MSKKLALFLIINPLFLLLTFSPAFAGILQDRINQYPHWESQILLLNNQQDLYFPEWFEGEWEVTSVLEEQIAPMAPKLVTPGFENNKRYLNKEVNFEVRYIRDKIAPKFSLFFPDTFSSKEVIVADRAFNGLAIAKAYLGEENVQSVTVNPKNPNEQTTILTENNKLISTVIGRQQETVSPTRFITCEITRQFFSSPEGVYKNEPILYVNLVETLTDYNLVEPNLIRAKQWTAIYLSWEDPDYFLALNRPVALYFYNIELRKK
ncbi:MAG: hypothetical protein NZ901_01585 [Geminocystis sp.]|nr:hypothetical protein [Geminocystis sp.]MCS7146861.1 hypothetical protein [Geminocystis sp.]MDW8115686.1 hypothetical protein [Geminocystis sp.]MDW8463230.1 hypothetical protein [Geminocystis sp.]HIK36771.1 hypothetical protein [Geminocystis sp. M7585_C2015_104]